MEWKLFEGDTPHVSTQEFHSGRERAPHLEQPGHRERLHLTASMIGRLCSTASPVPLTLTDLGCGDGGLLSLVQSFFADAWGYDFQPSNEEGWDERDVRAFQVDFVNNWEGVVIGEVVVMTEVLEHLADPFAMLKKLHDSPARYLICSSPCTETDRNHCAEHAWAWDKRGYAELLFNAGWRVLHHQTTGMFHIVTASRRKSWDSLGNMFVMAGYEKEHN